MSFKYIQTPIDSPESKKPIIVPADLNDCQAFIKKHWWEIRRGEYDISIRDEWIDQLGNHTLVFLANHCHSSRQVLASHSSLHPKVLEALKRKGGDDIRELVAKHPNATERILVGLARDKWHIRELI